MSNPRHYALRGYQAWGTLAASGASTNPPGQTLRKPRRRLPFSLLKPPHPPTFFVYTLQSILVSGSSYKKEKKKGNRRAHHFLMQEQVYKPVKYKRMRIGLVQEKSRRDELLADHRAAEARRKALEDAMQMERAIARIAAQNAELRWVQIGAKQMASLWLQIGRCLASRIWAGQSCRITRWCEKIESTKQKLRGCQAEAYLGNSKTEGPMVVQ
jgi:hypothetical protein